LVGDRKRSANSFLKEIEKNSLIEYEAETKRKEGYCMNCVIQTQSEDANVELLEL
jgi:DNA polymerase sigma